MRVPRFSRFALGLGLALLAIAGPAQAQDAAVLDLVRADLAAGAFAQAQARADSVLRRRLPSHLRPAALVLAGDAAYGLGAYRRAAERYAEALQSDELPADASHAALALGWAELRLGRREAARLTWMRVARQFPAAPEAPIALILAAELSDRAGETAVARKLLERVLEGYPATPSAEIARLNRSIAALRDGRMQEGSRGLRLLTRSGGPSVPTARQKLLDGLMDPGAGPGPERRMLLTDRHAAMSAGPIAADGRPHSGSATPESRGMLERFAAPFLDRAHDPDTTARVLHALLLLALEDKAWAEVEALAGHLIARYPGYAPAPELLIQVAGQAAAARQWPLVRTGYEYAIARAGHAALAPRAQVDFGEALFRTGDALRARTELARFVDTSPRAPESARALHLLATVNEALDQPQQALAAYDLLRRDFPRAEWATQSLLPHARLLQQADGRQKQARVLLEDIVQRAQGEDLTEASFRLAQVLAAEGAHPRAVDWYMAAAYGTTERSRWHRPALLGAGRSLTALKRTPAALAVYRSILPSPPIGPLPRDGRPPPELLAQVEEPELVAEAAYQIAEIARAAGRHDEAADMYLTAAALAPGAQGRALMGAVRSLVALGDQAAADAVFRRLVESSGEEPEILTEASKVFRPGR